jgi:hypothetical protein
VRGLLISEGSHEGSRAEEKPQALQALVSRVLPSAVFDWLDVHDLPRGNLFPGKGGGHLKLAWKAMLHATRNGFDALILVTDADGRHERITEFDEGQQSDRFPIPRALGIAVEAFDAWVLADHQAMSQALERTVPLQPLPENFTGGKGSPRHPKQVCRALLEQHSWGGTQAEFYATVCRCAELAVLAERCPRGFQPFLQRLNRLQQDLVERPAR